MPRYLNLRLLWIILFNLLVIGLLLESGLRVFGPDLPGPLGVTARWITTGEPYAQDWTPAWQHNRDHYYALRPDIENQLQYGSPTVRFNLSTIELWEGGGIGFRARPIDYFVDVVVVGDSFGFCFTEREDCWVNQLEANTGLGTVNLSQPVTGTTSHLRILRDFGQPLTPPLVIWQFFGNDFNDDYGLAVFRDEIEEIPDTAPDAPAPSPLDWLRHNSAAYAVIETALNGYWAGAPEEERLFTKPHTAIINEHRLQYGGLYELQALDMSREVNQIGLELSREAFTEAKTLVESWGGKLVVVIIPTREEVYAEHTRTAIGDDGITRLSSTREAMHELCTSLEIPCYDLLEDFRAADTTDDLLYYADDMHLNPHGNQVMASLLRAWLSEQGYIP